MGIQGLTRLLKHHAPQALTRTSPLRYQGQTLAVDVSCPLNRYTYGDDPHPFPHIHGFYMLVKFCERLAIKPIFIFDGTTRIVAKQQWEHRRRARNHLKIKESLEFEQSRSTRLTSWQTTLEGEGLSMLTSKSIQRLLDQLSGADKLKNLDSIATTLKTLDNLTPQNDDDSNMIPPRYETMDDSTLVQIYDKEQQEKALEAKLSTLVKELYETNEYVQDRERYTKTVRDLSNQEYDLMNSMIQNRLDSVHDELIQLKEQNNRLLASYGKRSRRVTKTMKDACYSFLSTLGYPCLVSENHEAEAMCANLVRRGMADGVVSEDMDSIVFGDGPLLRYFFAKNRPILHVDPVTARQQLGLTGAQFLDLCILCGTDFGSKIYGVGPQRALELVKLHGSIEEILIHLDPRKYIPEEGFDYRLIRKVFQELPTIPANIARLDTFSPRTLVNDGGLRVLFLLYQIDPDEVDDQLDIYMQQLHRNSSHEPFTTLGDNGFGGDPFKQRQHLSPSDTPMFT